MVRCVRACVWNFWNIKPAQDVIHMRQVCVVGARKALSKIYVLRHFTLMTYFSLHSTLQISSDFLSSFYTEIFLFNTICTKF